jgi:hypothetical protein
LQEQIAASATAGTIGEEPPFLKTHVKTRTKLEEHPLKDDGVFQRTLLACASTLKAATPRPHASLVCESPQHGQTLWQIRDSTDLSNISYLSQKQFDGSLGKGQMSAFVLLALYDGGASKEELNDIKWSGMLFGKKIGKKMSAAKSSHK